MYISDLAIYNFRSYRQAFLKLQPGINVFCGQNGAGKTNLVEAIAYLATFSSHRVAADVALVHKQATEAVIQARCVQEEGESVLEVKILPGKANSCWINRGPVKPTELLGIVKVVVFAPEDLEKIKGEPGARRNFLDELLIQVDKKNKEINREYNRVLSQRAALLKTARKCRRSGRKFDERNLEVWDRKIASLGAEIIARRAEIIQKLRPYVMEYYRLISGGKGKARIDYEANINIRRGWELPDPAAVQGEKGEELALKAVGEIQENEEKLQNIVGVEAVLYEQLQKWRETEIERGVNLVGPHRDDIRLLLQDLPAKGYASHGETWSYALALRLAEWEILRNSEADLWGSKEEPILILDDVFSELDMYRRERLMEIITEAEQVIITSASGEELPERATRKSFLVANYEVVEKTETEVEAETEENEKVAEGK